MESLRKQLADYRSQASLDHRAGSFYAAVSLQATGGSRVGIYRYIYIYVYTANTYIRRIQEVAYVYTVSIFILFSF